MSIDINTLLNTPLPDQKVDYTDRDVLLYNLSIGASQQKFVYEGDSEFSVIPTYTTCYRFKGESFGVVPFSVEGFAMPGVVCNPAMILHGEQETIIHQHPIPLSGPIINKRRVVGCYDKGKGAVIVTETDHVKDGVVFATNSNSIFIRGLGGFGGDRGPAARRDDPPNREPDAVHVETTWENQAKFYRLSGDYNPLHIDPNLATMVGFERPILHGLCTYGIACRAVLEHFCDNDVSRLAAFRVRFASPVLPGDTLTTKMWKEGNKVIFLVEVNGKPVISNASADLNESHPKL
eukprot:TRINITY_DN3813_c0_g2_i1.p1 TRINITY_DN3813_c0_g2~~TRINITY_DN3813_c0_g2_i1.p1  ORF type:complete len:306 (-),score=72.98 TRINITY_DN3813_c0_g2_i1:42-917(-)